MCVEAKFLTPSLTSLREETRVVNIAVAIKTPHTGFKCKSSEIAKTGIKLAFLSDKTIVWSINSIPNKKPHISAQDIKISL